MQFIMSLKGSQFVTGLVLALEGFVLFFACAVLATPHTCERHGPGVGLSVGAQATYQIILQGLAWSAFILLPCAFLHHYHPLSYKPRACCPFSPHYPIRTLTTHELRTWSSYASQLGEVTLLGRQARRHDAAQRALDRRNRLSTTEQTQSPRAPATPAAAKPPPRAAADGAGGKYTALKDEEAGEDAAGGEEVAAGGEGGGEGVVDGEGGADDLAPAQQPASGVGAWCPHLSARHNYGNNRILGLMTWDMLAFAGAMSLFAALVIALAVQRADEEREQMVRDLNTMPGAVVSGLGSTTLHTVSPATAQTADATADLEAVTGSRWWGYMLLDDHFWGDWRVEVSFFLCRMVYALSALPFMVFHVPLLRTLLSHTFATGYTPAGECVQMDATGLSAFTRWLATTLPSSHMRPHLTAKELSALEALLVDAHAACGGGGSSVVERAAGKRALHSFEERLTHLIPPSHPIFATCFPERALCIAYAKAQAEARRAKKAAARGGGRAAKSDARSGGGAAVAEAAGTWEEEMGAMYGVTWQPNKDSEECSLCAERFTMWRRRHHCRSCGRLCCDRCSRARLVPPRGASNPKRACDQCAQERDDGVADELDAPAAAMAGVADEKDDGGAGVDGERRGKL